MSAFDQEREKRYKWEDSEQVEFIRKGDGKEINLDDLASKKPEPEPKK